MNLLPILNGMSGEHYFNEPVGGDGTFEDVSVRARIRTERGAGLGAVAGSAVRPGRGHPPPRSFPPSPASSEEAFFPDMSGMR